MTALDQRCECCGYQNHYAGVASTSAPLSIAWCHICLAIGAEPWVVFTTFLDPDSDGNYDLKECTTIPHFNQKEDRYYLGPEPITVDLKDGRSFVTRGSIPDVF